MRGRRMKNMETSCEMRSNSGVTAVELLVVLSVIALMSAVALPNLTSWKPRYHLRSAADQVKFDMECAKLRAIRESSSVVVSFDNSRNAYEAFVDNGEGGGNAGNSIRESSERVLFEKDLPPTVRFYEIALAGGNPYFSFGPSGYPRSGSGHLSLISSDGSTKHVRISLTGHISAD